jgi:hypothetical protein
MINANFLAVFIFAFVYVYAANPLDAAELKPETAKAFDHYVQIAEDRMEGELESSQAFLWIDALSGAERASAYARLRNGEVLLHSLAAGLDIPGGMIHDWIGIVFIPNATLDVALSEIQNYDNYAQVYSPAVIRSKILKRDVDDSFTVALRLQKKGVRTVVLDVVSNAQYFSLDRTKAYSHTRSIRINEVENLGTPQEKEESPDAGHGYLWRLNDYRRLVSDTTGVYMQFEVIALSRNIPWGFGWLIKPLVTRVPQESLNFTLSRARDSIKAAVKQDHK